MLEDGRVESNGNFHGAPLGYAADFLAIVLTDMTSMAERRVDRMLDLNRSHGLPPFLAHEPGVDSGLMLAQYTAAGLLAESRILSHPCSVDTVPTSGMQEDHVSLGWTGARKLRRVVENANKVIAIEIYCAARALDLRAPLQPGPATGAVLKLVREHVDGPGPDRPLALELAKVADLVRAGEILETVTNVIGALK